MEAKDLGYKKYADEDLFQKNQLVWKHLSYHHKIIYRYRHISEKLVSMEVLFNLSLIPYIRYLISEKLVSMEDKMKKVIIEEFKKIFQKNQLVWKYISVFI